MNGTFVNTSLFWWALLCQFSQEERERTHVNRVAWVSSNKSGTISANWGLPKDGSKFWGQHMSFPADFLGSSAHKESACNTSDPGLIPGLGRSAGEGIGYPLQYFGTSLVAQTAKNLSAMQETWVQSLGGKIPWRRANFLIQKLCVCICIKVWRSFILLNWISI